MKIMTIELRTNPGVTLTAYLLDYSAEMPNLKVRPALLISPGGGYQICSDREAEPIAMAFLAEGYQAFILRYSLNENAAFPKPLRDAEEALELIRKNAEEWGVDRDRIAACGFSAGGHLSAALGTMGRLRPNALILGYPAILDSISDILPSPIPSLDELVDSSTPPAFLFATTEDSMVPVEHTLRFAAALNRAKVPFELHIFQKGEHGLSLAKPLTSSGYRFCVDAQVEKWFSLCVAWLKSVFGDFKADTVISGRIPTEQAAEYSVDISIKVCFDNPVCKQIILESLPIWMNMPILKAFTEDSLRQINEYNGLCTEATLVEIDQKLKKVPYKAVPK